MISDIFFLVVTVLLLCLTVLVGGESVYRVLVYRSATGRVTGYRRKDDCYLPEFEFVTDSGEKVACVSNAGRGVKEYRTGDEIRVLYHPRDPHRAAIRSFSSLWAVPIGLALIATVFVLGTLKELAKYFSG